MSVPYQLSGFPAALGWSIGPIAIRGDDVYAVIGLIAGLVLLSLWVILENVRLTRWRPGKAGSAEPVTSSSVALGSSGVHTVAEADMSPVPARVEWLLDDNTLVRTGAVRRGPPRPVAIPPQPKPAIARTADPAAIGK